MLKKRIIPTLLLKDNVLVKDKQFRSKRCIGSILPVVKVFNIRQVDEMVILDVEATNKHKDPDYQLIKDISKYCFVPLTVGGGITQIEQIRKLLKCGADKVSINSIGYTNQDLIKEAVNIFGSQCIIISIDVKKINDQYICFSHSGTINTNYVLEDWLKIVDTLNVGEILITSIDNDGMMQGYDIELIQIVKTNTNTPIIVSGGCSSYEDMYEVFERTNVSAVSASSIFQFTNLTPKGAKEYLKKRNINVRKIFV